ncbi:MAG: phosphotransferase [Candidatus Sericytochromatia bacterium]
MAAFSQTRPLLASELEGQLKRLRPGFEPVSAPVALKGGYLNYVWRLQGKSESWIAKQALPFLAAFPEQALSPARLAFEAKALEALGPTGSLAELRTETVRAPQLLAYEPEYSLLWMEDIGSGPDLYHWLLQIPSLEIIAQRAQELASFLADFHAYSASHVRLAKDFHNLEIQTTRLKLQYDLATWLPQNVYEHDVYADLQQTVFALGERLLKPGKCLIMGDLWPASICMTEQGIRLIDWEFVHWGQPAQDLGHLMAHCWLMSEAHAGTAIQVCTDQFWRAFSKSYWQRIEFCCPQLWQENDYDAKRIHAGAEILIRTVGPFQKGGYFAGIPVQDPQIQKALALAQKLILDFQA